METNNDIILNIFKIKETVVDFSHLSLFNFKFLGLTAIKNLSGHFNTSIVNKKYLQRKTKGIHLNSLNRIVHLSYTTTGVDLPDFEVTYSTRLLQCALNIENDRTGHLATALFIPLPLGGIY